MFARFRRQKTVSRFIGGFSPRIRSRAWARRAGLWTSIGCAGPSKKVTVMQLVKARDGTTDQKLADAFETADQPILEAASAQLEGSTAPQKNPHPKGSLAFAAWVIARLGGWTGYYGKPGPKVMRRGLDDFQRIKYGTTLRL